jgi:hypothetical protein
MLIQTGVDEQALREAIRMCFSNRGTPFSGQVIREILTDTLFQDRLETHRKRHFSELAVPDIETVLNDMSALVGSLKM